MGVFQSRGRYRRGRSKVQVKERWLFGLESSPNVRGAAGSCCGKTWTRQGCDCDGGGNKLDLAINGKPSPGLPESTGGQTLWSLGSMKATGGGQPAGRARGWAIVLAMRV